MSTWVGARERAGLEKTIGFDAELGNAIEGADGPVGTGPEAARALLAEIPGVMASRAGYGGSYGSYGTAYGTSHGDGYRPGGYGGGSGGSYANPQDQDRRFLSENGGCAYIDLGHLELATPEVSSAFDHVASWHAMLRIARRALDDANRGRPPGRRVRAFVNNSDGHGNSYGSHLSLRLTRQAWENLFERRLHYLVWLAGFQVSSVVWSGQGKVGSENGAPDATYQLAQRADFFEQLMGPQTTWARPIVNSRDEPLEGRGSLRAARLHVIFFDNALSPLACLLRAGTMQILLAMLEAEAVESGWLLEDPLVALRAFSRDPGLAACARGCDGRRVTAVELQRLYFERARHFVLRGGCEGTVPRAEEILKRWDETLTLLERRDFQALSRRLDWALKLSVIERARSGRPGMGWNHPALKHLDLLYGSLDREEGIYLGFEREGLVERVVGEEDVHRFEREPPEDTRAWTRAMLLRRHGWEIEEVDWDVIRVRVGREGTGSRPRTLDLSDPLGSGRAMAESCFEGATDLESLIDALEASLITVGSVLSPKSLDHKG